MANTVAVTRVDQGRDQFQGMWTDMWKVVALWSDQDAIADDVSILVTFDLGRLFGMLGEVPLNISARAGLATRQLLRLHRGPSAPRPPPLHRHKRLGPKHCRP